METPLRVEPVYPDPVSTPTLADTLNAMAFLTLWFVFFALLACAGAYLILKIVQMYRREMNDRD